MYKKTSSGWTKHIDFIIFDLLCLLISVAVTMYFRFRDPRISWYLKNHSETLYVMLIADFAFIIIFSTFKNVLKRGYYIELVQTLKQSIGVLLGATAYIYLSHDSESYSRFVVTVSVIVYTFLTYIVRISWKKFLKYRMDEQIGNTLLMIAKRDEYDELIDHVKNNNYASHKIIGVVADSKKGETILDIPIVATYDEIVEYVKCNWVDEVLLSMEMKEELPAELIGILTDMGVTVHVCLDFSRENQAGTKQVISNIGSLLVVTNSNNFISARQAFAKRAMDIFGGLVGCLLVGILYIFVAPLIKRESPGPAFFTQMRIGKNGRPFRIYKFRSMYLDAEERKKELLEKNNIKDGLMFKMDFDPRIIGNKVDENGNTSTGIGAFIRSSSIDETPQFINVLKGDMSLVGTRPPLPDEYENYSTHHKSRLAIKPGITGLWQVSGRSEILDFEEVVKLDTEYINNWSIGLDIKILFKTIAVVLKKEGAK